MARVSLPRLVLPILVLFCVVYFIRQYNLPLAPLSSSSGRHTQAWNEDRWAGPEDRVGNRTLEKGVLVMLVRNEELHPARFSMRGIEDRFNHRFGYDWVFLNDKPFTDEFITYTSALASGRTYYGLIPIEHWSFPKWVDQRKAKENMKKMEEDDIIYGGSESYRHMCRFNSGFFFEHELMQKYDYYFRIEPFVEFYCDMYEDPFKFMRENKKKYGWVISMYEYDLTIPTLWQTTKDFAKKFPQYIAKYNSLGFLRDDDSDLQDSTYNLCHFWSNFEIADLRFLRSDAYREYFKFLDKTGGFFYERWGDAPVHSLAAALFLDNDEIHHFDDVGYRHNPYTRCPPNEKYHTNGQCSCNIADNFDVDGYSCKHQWDHAVEAATKAKKADS